MTFYLLILRTACLPIFQAHWPEGAELCGLGCQTAILQGAIIGNSEGLGAAVATLQRNTSWQSATGLSAGHVWQASQTHFVHAYIN